MFYAEGEKQAQITLAEGEKEAAEKMADGQATKIIVPSDIANLAGTIAALKEAVDNKDK